MLRRLIASIATVILLSAPYQVLSATFDFATIANLGEYGAKTITFDDPSGLSVTASGFSSKNNNHLYNAYLDSSWYHTGQGAPGGNGGLGVCKKINSQDQCKPSSDDSIGSYESLRLLFNQEVTIEQLVFRNGNHGEDFLGQFTVATGADPETAYDLTHIFETPLTGTEFIFTNINSGKSQGHKDKGKHRDKHEDRYKHKDRHKHKDKDKHKFNFKDEYKYEFYISSMEVMAVPVPAAAWLFASGLLFLAGFVRRRD